MPALLKGITHVIIQTAQSLQIAKETGVYAIAELCFGPGDQNTIAQVEYKQLKDGKSMSWQLPVKTVERDGKNVQLPIFTGELMLELSNLAAQAMARIKKELEPPKTNGKTYRVTKKKVEDITNGEAP
jgi:hypothetical protein